MKAYLVSGGLFVLLGLVPCLVADDQIDFTRPETPPKPAPKGLHFIDQGEHDPRLKSFKTPEGFKVEIVAEAPVVVNPVAMTFATDGTPYVLERLPGEAREVEETLAYKDGSTRKVLTMKKNVPDVVKVLRDSKGKGIYDESKVVLKDDLSSSILLHDGFFYLSGRGTVRRHRQSKPDGDYDVKEVIAQGFSGLGRQQVSGMTIGPDGWLYLTAGDNDNHVEGSDGSRATVLRTGGIFRCRPDGSKMHTYAIGFCNPYGNVAFDAVGNLFHADGDIPDAGKFTGCRLMHVAEEGDYGWRLRSGVKGGVPDLIRGAVFGELPGKMSPLNKTGRGAPAGLLIYNDTRLPENYRGQVFYPDALRQRIRAYRLEADGSSFAVTEEFEFLRSDDPHFRPCQMVTGPDGAIYVVDSCTDLATGRLSGDGKHGRIFRITWSGTREQEALPRRGMDNWAKIVKREDAELLKALDSDEGSERTAAQRELVRRGKKNTTELIKIVKNDDAPEHAQIAALGVLQSFWSAEVEALFEDVLATGTRDLRRLAAEGLGLNARPGDRLQAALLKALATEDPALQRAVALAMGRLAAPGAADALANTLAFNDGKDLVLHDGLIRAIESLGKPGLERLVALADSGVQKDLDRVVDVFSALRTRPGVELLPILLKNPHLSIEQRAVLIGSYNNYLLDPGISLEPLLNYLLANPAEPALVKRAALVVLGAAGSLKGEKEINWLLTMLDETEAGVRLAAIRAAEDTRLKKAVEKLRKMMEAGPPVKEREAILKALRVLEDGKPGK